jgi:diguanylate cyclase (GGDEF)-like protein
MEAKSSAGVYERAVRGVRRLAELARASEGSARVHDLLVQELTVLLGPESVTLAGGGEGAAAGAGAAGEAGTRQRPEDRRRLVLELRATTRDAETVVLCAREQHPFGPEEAAAAAALVQVAAVVLALVEARQQAATDELTGCLNRRAGLTRLGEELARSQRARSPVSCLMLDVDNLKQVNDTFGHLEGDRVLRDTGASLRAQRRAYDVAARYGGDEFLVILPAADHHAATRAAARMTAAVARIKCPAAGARRLPISVTCGAATSRPDERPETLLRRADRALLAAKADAHPGPARPNARPD